MPENSLQSFQSFPARNADAIISHLRQAIADGKHWYLALLEAIGLWTDAEEVHDERSYRYLIAGEAFDWLLLAERLCQALDGLLPENEKTALLFHGKPPLDLTTDEFQKLIGSSKFQQYLNYFYGVIAEEALILAVQDEVRKEKWASGYTNHNACGQEAHRRIYGTTDSELLERFRDEKGCPQSESTSLTEHKEFTYWLFKYRLNQCDKARAASDTQKALKWLKSKSSPWYNLKMPNGGEDVR